jgi:Leucine-rich repeat (LRR) protein
LDGNKLTSVPEWVPPGLQELNLASNRLTTVPEWFPVRMARMIRLLSLQHNLVSELPKSFRLLLGLEMLALRGNPLVSIDAGPLSSLYNNGATASELVRWLRSKPLRKLKLAVHLVQMGLKSSGLTGDDEPTDQRNQSDRE